MPKQTSEQDGLSSFTGEDGGGKDWVSHPAKPDTFTDNQAFQSKPVSTI